MISLAALQAVRYLSDGGARITTRSKQEIAESLSTVSTGSSGVAGSVDYTSAATKR